MYSLPSGPNLIRPPSWATAPGLGPGGPSGRAPTACPSVLLRNSWCGRRHEAKLDLGLVLRAQDPKDRGGIEPEVGHQNLGRCRPAELWAQQLQHRRERHGFHHVSDLEVPGDLHGNLATLRVLRGQSVDSQGGKFGHWEPGRLQPAFPDSTVSPLTIRLKPTDIDRDGPDLAGAWVGAVNDDLAPHRPGDSHRDVETVALADQRLPDPIDHLRLAGYNAEPLDARGRSCGQSDGKVAWRLHASPQRANDEGAQHRCRPCAPHPHESCSSLNPPCRP